MEGRDRKPHEEYGKNTVMVAEQAEPQYLTQPT